MSDHENENTNDESVKDVPADEENNESNSTCMICQEEWTIVSEHRISCLKCGHLFGKSCILRWIETQGSSAKCPICNKPAKKSEVRQLWCRAIRATDNSELSSLQKLLDDERKLRKADAAIIFHQDIKLKMLYSELEKLKRGIIDRDAKIERMESMMMRYNKAMAQRAAGVNGDEDQQIEIDLVNQSDADDSMNQVVVEPRQLKGMFHFAEKVESSPTGGCKAFAICPTASILLVAQPSPQVSGANIFGAFGLRKFSVIDTNVREFIPLHSKDITSIKLKPVGDLILTASLDKRIKLTSISNNTCIQSFQSEFDPLCVAWSAHRDQQFYVASANCFVTLYDIRNTQEYIYQTERRVANSRAISITATTSDDVSGVLFNDICGSQFLEVSDSSDYELETIDRSISHLSSHRLPFAGNMGTVDFCKHLNLSLISTRRTAQHPNMAHHLVKLSKVTQEDGTSQVECKGIQTFFGAGPGELLSQSRILRHPTLDDHVLVGATDPSSRGIKLWDSSDNSDYQTIKESEFVRDLLMYSPENSNNHILYTLSAKGLGVYRWEFA